jgi:hypothetical protein
MPDIIFGQNIYVFKAENVACLVSVLSHMIANQRMAQSDRRVWLDVEPICYRI